MAPRGDESMSAQLAEDPARPDRFEHPPVQREVDLALGDGEHRVARIALPEQHVSRLERLRVGGVAEHVDLRHRPSLAPVATAPYG